MCETMDQKEMKRTVRYTENNITREGRGQVLIILLSLGTIDRYNTR